MRTSRALVVTAVALGGLALAGCSASTPSDPKAAAAVEWINDLGAGKAPDFCQGPSSFDETPDVKFDDSVEPKVEAQPDNGENYYDVTLSVKDSDGTAKTVVLGMDKDDDGNWCVASHSGLV